MTGLTPEERRALEPIGPPGEFARDAVIQSLIDRALVPTALGRTMLALPPDLTE